MELNWGHPSEDSQFIRSYTPEEVEWLDRQFAQQRSEMRWGLSKFMETRLDKMLISRLRKGAGFYQASVDAVAKVALLVGAVVVLAIVVMFVLWFLVLDFISAHFPWYVYWGLQALIWAWILRGSFPRMKRLHQDTNCIHDIQEMAQGDGSFAIWCPKCKRYL